MPYSDPRRHGHEGAGDGGFSKTSVLVRWKRRLRPRLRPWPALPAWGKAALLEISQKKAAFFFLQSRESRRLRQGRQDRPPPR